MANRFFNPFTQFFDDTGNVLAGGKLYFYLTATSSARDTYSDSALSVANSNPVVLDAAGRLPDDVFIDPSITYKVVLKTSADVEVWTADPYVDPAANVTAAFQVYAGDPNGNVAGNQGSVGGSGASVIYDITNDALYVCTTTGTASTAVWTQIGTNIAGAVKFTGVISPSSISTQQDDYAPAGIGSAFMIRQDASADVSITGLTPGSDPDGREIRLQNISSANFLTIAAESASSTAANRFSLNASVVLFPGESIVMWYDNTSSRWRRVNDDLFSAKVTLTDAASIAWDLNAGGARQNYEVTLGGNRTLDAFTGGQPGMTGTLTVINDTGGRSLGFNSVYKFSGNRTEPISATSVASERTTYAFKVYSSTAMELTRIYTRGRSRAGAWAEVTVGSPNTSNVRTVAHGLSSVSRADFFLRCDTAELGYTVGDLVPLSEAATDGSTNAGITCLISSSAVKAVIGSVSPKIVSQNTFGRAAISAGNWTIIARVYD